MTKLDLRTKDAERVDLNIQEVGGKGFYLQKLMKAGLPVPPFFVIPVNEMRDLFISASGEPIFDAIESEIGRYEDGGPNKDQSISLAIAALIDSARINHNLLEQISQQCRVEFGKNFLVSVRSSAIDEDGENHSFAGQHQTVLYVENSGLEGALRKTLISAWSHGALSYRRSASIPIKGIQYAVVIQKMIHAARSGIGFSMDTTRNLAESVITCAFGIGEGIVSASVDADTFYVNRVNESISSICRPKTSMMTWSQKRGTYISDVAVEDQSRPCLSNEELRKVYQLLRKAEDLIGKPADIEFVIDEQQIYLMQLRPVSTMKGHEIEILDNTNIAESYPGITLPLSYSFASMAYESIFRKSAKLFRVKDQYLEDKNVFQNLIAHFQGRVYYRLDNWYRMTARVYNSRSALQAWEEAVGLPDSQSSSIKFPWKAKFKMSLVVLQLIFNYKSNNRKFFEAFTKNYNRFKKYPEYKDSASSLWYFFNEQVQKTLGFWPYTIVNDFLAFKTYGWLQGMIRKWRISEDPDIANGLISGFGMVYSEQAVAELLGLKESISDSVILRKLFEEDTELVLSVLNAAELGSSEASFYSDMKQYLQLYGDRTLAELKLETITPRMEPLLFIDLLKSQLNNNLSKARMLERQQGVRTQAEKELRLHLAWFYPRYWIFQIVRRIAGFGVMSRENMRFCRTRMYAVSREVFLEFGKLMVREGILEDERDIFYLNLTEIKAFCLGAAHNIEAVLQERKKEFNDWHGVNLPDRIMYETGSAPYFTSNEGSLFHADETGLCLNGIPVSRGEAEGEALVISEPILTADVRGKILISKVTDPGWVFLMSQAIALVTEKGSILSHTAIVGRELGLPVVVGVADVMTKIKTGDMIRVDGTKGTIRILRASK